VLSSDTAQLADRDTQPPSSSARAVALIFSPAGVGAITLLVLVARGLAPFTRPQYMSDEPAAFAAAALADPFGSVLAPWSGFLHVVARLAHLSVAPLPLAISPAVTVLELYIVIAIVAAFLSSSRLEAVIPDRRVRIAAALMLAVLPGTRIAIASVLNVHWYTALLLAALAVATDTPRWRWFDRVAVVLASLSGPATIVLAPVYWSRVRESRHRLVLALIVTAVAVVQGLVYLASDRASAIRADAPGILVERVGLSVLGEGLGALVPPAVLVVVGAAIAVAIVKLVRGVTPRALTTFGLLGLALAVAGVMTQSDFSTPSASTRYFIPLAFVVSLVVLAGLRNRRVVAFAISAVLLIGVVRDYRIPTYPDAGWPAAAACLEQDAPCRVETFTAKWSFTWPGRRDYRRPAVPADVIDHDCCVNDAP
jgi:MFS family permease